MERTPLKSAIAYGPDGRERPLTLVECELLGLKERKRYLPLTDAQRSIVEMVSQGLLNKEIAHQMGWSEPRTKLEVSKIMTNLEFLNRTELAVWWYSITRRGLHPWTPEQRRMVDEMEVAA